MFIFKTCTITLIEDNCAAKIIPVPFLFLAALFLTGCADTFIPELNVHSVTYDSEKLSVTMSDTPDSSSFQKGFSLTEDNASVNGRFIFAGNTVHFFPDYGIRSNYDYKLILSTQIEDTDGRSLMHDFSYCFSTRQNSENPRLIHKFPENQEYLSTTPEELIFTFSKPIDTQSFINSFTISPDFQYFCSFSDEDTKVHIIPCESLKKSSRYTVSISASLQDKHRNPMIHDENYVFYHLMDSTENEITVFGIRSDGTKLELEENISISNIRLNDKFEINFSKQIQTDSISSYLSIIPPLSYSIAQDKESMKKVSLEFSNPDWNRTYSLRIKKGITDLYGNKTQEDRNYQFSYNNEADRPLEFEGIIFQTAENDYSAYNQNTNYTDLPLDSLYFAKNTEIPAVLYVIFSSSAEAEKLDFYSAIEGVSVSSTNGCCSIELKSAFLIEECDFSTIPISLPNTNSKKLQIIKFNMEITNKSNSGLVILDFSNGIKDCLGNQLKENVRLSLNK